MRLTVLLLACSTLIGMSAARVAAQDAATEDAPDAATDVSPERAAAEASSSEPAASGTTSSGTTVVHVHTRDREREEPPPQSPFDPHELPNEGYHHLGVFARGIIAPQFIQNIFVDGGTTALNAGVGGFYNYRKDGLNMIAEVWWAGFFATAPFKGLNEDARAMEMLESELQVVFGNIVLMWSIPIASWLAIELGFGIGFGGVFGALYRTEAEPTSEGWTACAGPSNPPDNGAYCDPRVADGGEGHYQRIDGTPEPYNFSGGVPPLWFWLDLPRVAIRIKPLRQLQIRVEGGFTGYAFHAGGSVAFGF